MVTVSSVSPNSAVIVKDINRPSLLNRKQGKTGKQLVKTEQKKRSLGNYSTNLTETVPNGKESILPLC